MNQKFEYKLTPILWTLFIAGLIAAGVCVYLNITRFIALLSAEDADGNLALLEAPAGMPNGSVVG